MLIRDSTINCCNLVSDFDFLPLESELECTGCDFSCSVHYFSKNSSTCIAFENLNCTLACIRRALVSENYSLVHTRSLEPVGQTLSTYPAVTATYTLSSVLVGYITPTTFQQV